MKFSIHPDNQLEIQSDTIQLRAIQPVLNGAILADTPTDVQSGAEDILLSYSVPPSAVFWLSVHRTDDTHLALCYWIENAGDMVLDSFGIQIANIEGVSAVFRNGYFSWDGSEYVKSENVKQVSGYAMTQLLAHTGNNVVLGFDRHDRFQHTFTYSSHRQVLSLRIETLWDRKTPPPNEPCESETLVVFEHAQVENALREWARSVAAHSPLAPRHTSRIKGWCSWYNLYAYINEENILEHLRGVQEASHRNALPMHVFQIDDGFTPEMGDWLQVKPQFPRGMKPLLDDIRGAGFTPGLWIAPFMVGNRSHLFREHPDWVVRERESGAPLAQIKFYEEFRWHKRSEEYYILDTTHPDAFEYLRAVFRTWRYEWGCEYFKTDFMQFGSEHGAARALFHTPGMTRIEMWRRVAEMIREEIGDALWLGCGCPLWASVGLVDAVRIGRDVGTSWNGERAAASLLRDGATRNFASHILWQADPDCILLREHFHFLSNREVEALALFGGLTGGALTTSDALNELSAERIQLWQFLLNADITSCHFPLLGQANAVLVQVCHALQFDAVFVLNISETPLVREFSWDILGVSIPKTIFDWRGNIEMATYDKLSVSLESHEGKLYLIGIDSLDLYNA